MALITRELAQLEKLGNSLTLPQEYTDFVEKGMKMYKEEIQKIPESSGSNYSKDLIECQTWEDVNNILKTRDPEFCDIKTDDYIFDLMYKIDEEFGNLKPIEKYIFDLGKADDFQKFTEKYLKLASKYPINEVEELLKSLITLGQSVVKSCEEKILKEEI